MTKEFGNAPILGEKVEEGEESSDHPCRDEVNVTLKYTGGNLSFNLKEGDGLYIKPGGEIKIIFGSDPYDEILQQKLEALKEANPPMLAHLEGEEVSEIQHKPGGFVWFNESDRQNIGPFPELESEESLPALVEKALKDVVNAFNASERKTYEDRKGKFAFMSMYGPAEKVYAMERCLPCDSESPEDEKVLFTLDLFNENDIADDKIFAHEWGGRHGVAMHRAYCKDPSYRYKPSKEPKKS